MWLVWWGRQWVLPSEGVTPAEALRHKIAAQEEEMKKLRRELDQVARMKAASSSVWLMLRVRLLAGEGCEGAGSAGGWDWRRRRCGSLCDQLRGKLGSGVVVLGAVMGGWEGFADCGCDEVTLLHGSAGGEGCWDARRGWAEGKGWYRRPGLG